MNPESRSAIAIHDAIYTRREGGINEPIMVKEELSSTDDLRDPLGLMIFASMWCDCWSYSVSCTAEERRRRRRVEGYVCVCE